MLNTSFDFLKSLSLRVKLLGGIWVLFFFLVALGIHGSSTGVTAAWWAPEKPYFGSLLSLPPRSDQWLSRIDTGGLQSYLMGVPKPIRWDDFVVYTPYALSQLSHNPRFPLVNTNIGNGQNMLLVPHTPVWHIATLARPATWGYFIFGAQRGIAWQWWFQIFGCFTVLYLLFEILFKGHTALVAFGAFWFCASAYVVCWSLWSAHVTFFAALGCLAAYHLFSSEKRSTQLICAILLGLSFPGFMMFMYPPWQVATGYFFLLLFIILLIRDKLYLSFKSSLKYRLAFLALAVLIAGGLSLSWILTCLPDLKIMTNTVYPGRRVSLGGDYSFGQLFKGFYNIITVFNAPQGLKNESEAASFYYLFPAVFFAALISKRFARHLGLVGWAMIAYIVAMLVFLLVGLPQFIAKLTLLSYVPGYRADLTIGLASIILSLHSLIVIKRAKENGEDLFEDSMPMRVAVFIVLFFIVHSLFLMKETNGFIPAQFALFISLLAGMMSYFLIAGRTRAFLALTGSLVIATTALFNPLATNLDHIYDSELAKTITAINKQTTDRPFWVSYGGVHPGVLIEILGGRSLSGVHWLPQLDIWHAFDPDRSFEKVYNQYAEVSLQFTPDENLVSFNSLNPGALTVQVSPNNPVLKSLGARYVLIMVDAQSAVDTSKLHEVYKSPKGTFSIYEIP